MLDFLKKLKQKNISLFVEGEKIKITYSGDAPNPEVIEEIKDKKPDLIRFFHDRSVFSQSDFNEIDELNRYPLSFAQERLFFIEQFEQGSDAYHIPLLVEFNSDVDLTALQSAFNLVVERHPVLKTIYCSHDNGEVYQALFKGDICFQEKIIENKSALTLTVKQDIARPFKLSQEPSIRFHYYKTDKEQFLLILLHHISFDGWSFNPFFQELSLSYLALSQGNTPELQT
jgi:hypothetical protein